MYLSNIQESFIRELMAVGDDRLVAKRLNLDPLILLDWESENNLFRARKKQAEASYLRRLERDISRESLSSLHNALKFGEKITSSSTQTRQVLDMEGGIHELVTSKVTQKINKSPSWAVQQGIKLYMLQKVEESVSRSLKTLAEEGMLPEEVRDQILAVLDSVDSQINEIFAGNMKGLEVTEDLLSEVQSMIVSGN
jgi:hypothetical protein